jgi:hypothetical protein
MANEEHLAILRQGVEAWNKWHSVNWRVQPDLTEAQLHGANLKGVNFGAADLRGVFLREANLRGAYLREANLIGAHLWKTDLAEAELRGKSVESEYNGGRSYGGGFGLVRPDQSRSFWSDSTGCHDRSYVRGLDTVKFAGPSTLGIDTLIRSYSRVPEVFLRGCGVPDSLIEYLPSLMGAMQPIQFYSCFISFSTKDQAFTQRLYERMQSHHLRVWFAPEDMKGGAKLHEQIDQAIRVHDKLVLVLSEQSIQSEWVMTEIRKARKAELRDKRRKLFPIRLVDMDTLRDWECFDANTGKDLAVEVREYFIPDFTQWKDHDSFERAFTRFLKDLQATEAQPVPRTIEPPRTNSATRAGAQESIIEIKKRRLRLLVEQQARKGQDTEPHIVMEIEDLRREISELET